MAFIEYDIYENSKYINQLKKRTLARAYPQVFIENVSVAGFTELLEKDQQGLLATYTEQHAT